MIFIGGIEVERPQNLAKGISIIPFPLEKRANWARLPYDRLNPGSNQTLNHIKAALICEGSYPKRHELRENIDFNTPLAKIVGDFSDLDDAMLCVSLIGPSGPTKIANYTGFVDEVPMSESRKGRDSYYENIQSPLPYLNSDALDNTSDSFLIVESQ